LDWLREQRRAPLGIFPTPVEQFSLEGGPAIWVKRDDLSGWGRGGAKARKIEFLLGYMHARGYTDLVTVAGNVTNLAFDLLPALERERIGAHLHIIDDPVVPHEARHAIFAGLEGRVTLLGKSRTEAFIATWTVWARLRAQGRKPFWVLPGVSHPAGILGNAFGFIEMAEDLVARGQPLPETVFVTAATGTTVAGFLLAERALRDAGFPPIRVVGVQVYPGRTSASIRVLSYWVARHSGGKLGHDFPIEVDSSALAGGFGRYGADLADTCERVRSETGLFIDPIFGGKTWAAMEDHLRLVRPRDLGVLYWHCGYTPEWRVLGQQVSAGDAE